MSRVTAAPTMQPQTGNMKPSYEQICVRAYEKWVKKGRRADTQMQDWMEAEMELKREVTSGMPGQRR